MAVSPLQILFLLPLLFAPAYAKVAVQVGFNAGKLIDGVGRFFIGNDGGMKGDAGNVEDKEDSQTGRKAGFVRAEPADYSAIGDKNDFQMDFAGQWELVLGNSGVSAMHMQLMPHGEILIFDSTIGGPSQIKLSKFTQCLARPGKRPDCWAHGVMYNTVTGQVRPLRLETDPWCSSGGLRADGTFLSTGGFMNGDKAVRTIGPCFTCDWSADVPRVLGAPRWYATQVSLPDGSFFLIGGRKAYSYEYLNSNGEADAKVFYSKFMDETTDLDENNLYPFVHLLPDGNLFVFSNSRSILLDPRTNQVVKEFPRLKGGSRNYPASGMSALLPIRLDNVTNNYMNAQVIVCGGALPNAYGLADPDRKRPRIFLDALQDCGRIDVTDPKAKWKREKMPSKRVMGDMLILPTGDILMLNGAEKGASAWNHAANPNYTPVLFRPNRVKKDRFKVLTATTIPRMYHSTSAILPDGTVLVGGSNTNARYLFEGVEYPTEMRLEKFYPPYLDPALNMYRPEIMTFLSSNRMTYGNDFDLKFRVFGTYGPIPTNFIKVTMYAPPFTTHGYSMNQRLIELGVSNILPDFWGIQHVAVKAPPSGAIAPPGYYLLFVVYRGIPSVGIWINIQ